MIGGISTSILAAGSTRQPRFLPLRQASAQEVPVPGRCLHQCGGNGASLPIPLRVPCRRPLVKCDVRVGLDIAEARSILPAWEKVVDTFASRQDFERRLAETTSDAVRLALLLEFGKQTAEAQRADAEAETYLREAIDLARKAGTPNDLALAGVGASEFYRTVGDMARSLECAEIVKSVADSSGNPRQLGQYFFLVGRISQEQCDYRRARECFERCLGIWRNARYTIGAGAALNQLGSLAVLQGQGAEALERFQESLKIDVERGDAASEATERNNIGLSLHVLGRWEDAIEAYYRSIAVAEQHGLPALRAYALNSLGEVYLERDKTAKAIDIFKLVLDVAERGEVTPNLAHEAMCDLGLAYYRRLDFAGAEQAYCRAVDLAEASGDRGILVVGLQRMAELALRQGQLDRCRELVERSAAVACEIGLPIHEAQASRVRGLLCAARGEHAQARASFEHAIDLLHDLEDGLDMARVRFHYGRYQLAQGEREPALTLLKAASRSFRRLGVVAEAQEVDRLLFHQEVGVDRDMALLQGISGLVSLGFEPQVLLERAIGLLLEVLRFDGGAVVARGRPLLMTGRIDMKQATSEVECEDLVSTQRQLCWVVRFQGKPLGRIHLERTAPATLEYNQVVLDTVANLLSAPLHRLAELSVGEAKATPSCAGLRYKGVVGRNQRMVDVLSTVCAVASKSVPVLIRGESGTGKELVARALHDSGTRADKPFVAVNCAAVPDNLLEAEFFGIERGTATGVAAHKGKFEIANGGTIFLDEIGDMSLSLQSKLLRVLQEKTFERVGGHVPISVDVRVVAATNQPVADLMAQKRFREDLYYRLNTVELQLPTLNERAEDIPDLVRHFVRSSNQEFGRDVADVSPAAMSRLTIHHWVGNVRELQHVVERSVLLARGDMIEVSDLPPGLQPRAGKESETGDLREVRRDAKEKAAAEVERSALVDCLEKAGWNVEAAAKLAGYSRAQFYRLMRKHSISKATH
jgi:DNA-binding NtrC family response regulator/tetratricopeptide (TPR) repeat protein